MFDKLISRIRHLVAGRLRNRDDRPPSPAVDDPIPPVKHEPRVDPIDRDGAVISSPPCSFVDIETELDLRAAERRGEVGETDWRHSIVDLLKLADMDSSLPARRELAVDFGFEGTFNGTVEQNTWLHGMVMDELRREGL